LKRLSFFLFILAVAIAPASTAQDSPDRVRELERQVQELRQRVDALTDSADPELRAQIEELRRQIDVLTREIENLKSAAPEKPVDVADREATEALGLGPAAAKVYGLKSGVSIGGYGEVLYQNFASERQDGTLSNLRDRIDLLRVVLYFGYKFNEHFLFNSEIEYEHATTGEGAEEKGEVSVEFAYVDWRPSPYLGIRGGLVLLPLGFLNEMHEPSTFLSSRRPDTEMRLLPTTWRDLGIGLYGEAGGVAYRAFVVNGLDAQGFNASQPIRGGRQSGSQALAEDFAFTGRVDWVGLPGLLIGVSGYTGDSSQGTTVDGESFSGRVSLFDAHAEWRWRGLRVRGLYTAGTIGDAAQINELNGLSGESSVPSRFAGGYAEAGFDALSFRKGGGTLPEAAVFPFVRFERYNTQERVPAGFSANPANDVTLWTFGAMFTPIPQIALKADYQSYSNEAQTAVSQWNLSLGWLF
jgi:cell division protein FtsB